MAGVHFLESLLEELQAGGVRLALANPHKQVPTGRGEGFKGCSCTVFLCHAEPLLAAAEPLAWYACLRGNFPAFWADGRLLQQPACMGSWARTCSVQPFHSVRRDCWARADKLNSIEVCCLQKHCVIICASVSFLQVVTLLRRAGLLERLGEGAVHDNMQDAVESARATLTADQQIP